MNSRLETVPACSQFPLLRPGIDAVILLGASCEGPEAYAAVASELGYGELAMPIPCDTETIRAQLRQRQTEATEPLTIPLWQDTVPGLPM